MRYAILGSACALALALGGAALGQSGSSTTTTTSTVTMSPEQRTEFHEYVVKEHRPSITLNDFDVREGATLPPSVSFYSVPKVDRYQYTVVNQKRVMVEPSTRRIVEVWSE